MPAGAAWAWCPFHARLKFHQNFSLILQQSSANPPAMRWLEHGRCVTKSVTKCVTVSDKVSDIYHSRCPPMLTFECTRYNESTATIVSWRTPKPSFAAQ